MMASLLLSCMRYARLHVRSSVSGTCEGACRHYTDCKGDDRPESFEVCLADCREIYVDKGEPDRGSLTEFEDLECKDAVAFVDGNQRGRKPTATSGQVKARSTAQ